MDLFIIMISITPNVSLFHIIRYLNRHSVNKKTRCFAEVNKL